MTSETLCSYRNVMCGTLCTALLNFKELDSNIRSNEEKKIVWLHVLTLKQALEIFHYCSCTTMRFMLVINKYRFSNVTKMYSIEVYVLIIGYHVIRLIIN